MTNENGKHVLHKEIGSLLQLEISKHSELNLKSCELILDQACGEILKPQQIPLFTSSVKSRSVELCKVDILILKQKQISVIIEIEESGLNPTKICGKFLTSALCTHYIHGTEQNSPILMADKVLFVQIVDEVSLPVNSNKRKQFINIEESIGKILPIAGSHIYKYKLVCTEFSKLLEDKEGLLKPILDHLR